MSKYTSDQPITEPTNDEFNRAVFATDFIKIISNFKDTESYVIGLYGKWGSGKTSTINLILKQLASKNDIYSISINAWALGGDHEIILWDILNQISTKLTDKKAKTKRARFGHLLKKVSKAELPFDLSSEIPLDSSTKNNMNSSSGKILNTVSYLGQILSSSDNISLARNRIESYIKNKKIIVFIDDLDRLPGKQIINILRSINTIADYGGISYVLPIDIQYVSSAVEEQLPFGQSGSEFIEKVIQLPIDLPTLTQEKIDHVLFDKINILLIEHKITLSEDEIQRFQRLYFELNKYIKSPRDINKIINVLRFRMPISNTEINIVDLIILEIIRLFDKRFYEIIKTHRDLLINHIHIPSVKYRLDSHNKKRTIDADKLDINSDQKEILQQLFPAFDALYTNTNFSNKDTLRKLKRIADENYFDLFFASLDSEINVSNKQILEIVQLSDTPDKLNKALFSTINTNNFDFALRLIIDNISLVKDTLTLSTNLLDLVDTFQTKYDSPGLQLSPFSTLLLRINDILRGSNTKLADYITLLDHNYHKKRIETLPLLIREVDVYSEKKDSKYHINLTEDELAEYKNMHSK